MDTTDRAVGCLLGVACGDALGRPVEGLPSRAIRARFGRLTEMRGDGVHGLPAGSVTDDAALTLRVARSCADCGGYDATDLAARFVDWYAGDPVGVGSLTAEVLERVRAVDAADAAVAAREAAAGVHAARPEGRNAGNGSLMRCAPHGLAVADPDRLAEVAADASALTHADPRCTEACVALTGVVAAFLAGADPAAALDRALRTAADRDAPDEVRTVLSVATDREMATLSTTGYVVHTLETGLHDALTAGSLEEAVVTAVNRGGDADTVGAVAGAVAGARFGAAGVPGRWLDALDADLVDEVAELGGRLAGLRSG
jgi:ADP-ribosyl-[dinitrogen reductase] hydrolase